MLSADVIVELIGVNKVAGWLVFEDDSWKKVEIGEYARYLEPQEKDSAALKN